MIGLGLAGLAAVSLAAHGVWYRVTVRDNSGSKTGTFAVTYPLSAGTSAGAGMFFTPTIDQNHVNNMVRMGTGSIRFQLWLNTDFWFPCTVPSNPADLNSGSLDLTFARTNLGYFMNAGIRPENVMGAIQGVVQEKRIGGPLNLLRA